MQTKKFLKIVLSLGLVLSFSSVSLFAKDSKKDEAGDLKIGGKIYLQWQDDLESNENTFGVTRAYLQLAKKLDEMFSIKVTADAIHELPSDATVNDEEVTAKSSAYEFYLKNAYLKGANKIMDGLKYSFSIGMIGTPNIGLVDNMSDYRWIYNNYLDKSKDLLGTSLDSSADLGVNLNLNIMKMVSVTGAITNGEGYKSTNDDSKGKAFYGMVSVNPFQLGEDKKGDGLFLNGFMRREDDIVQDGDNLVEYYGAGVAWKSALIKAGGNYFWAKKKASDTKYTLVDCYANANLDSVIKLPVLAMGRFAYGKDNDNDDSKVTKIAGGVGYKFNKSFRTAVYYEKTRYETTASNDMFYVKAEAKY